MNTGSRFAGLGQVARNLLGSNTNETVVVVPANTVAPLDGVTVVEPVAAFTGAPVRPSRPSRPLLPSCFHTRAPRSAVAPRV